MLLGGLLEAWKLDPSLFSHSSPHGATTNTYRSFHLPCLLISQPYMFAETLCNCLSLYPACLHALRLQPSYQHRILWPSSVLDKGNMSAIPQTLQLTKAARKQQRNATGNSGATSAYFDIAEMDQPARYNSKLMNSIWGRYNENSVHNFKSLQCGTVDVGSAHNAYEAGETLLPPSSSPLNDRNAMKRCLRELGEAVSNNFMDNLNQY